MSQDYKQLINRGCSILFSSNYKLYMATAR